MTSRDHLLEKLTRMRRPRQRGAAFVEAILLIIFMTIIFAGVIYLGKYFEAQQKALGTARECAWLYSMKACTDKHELPEKCQTVFGEPETQRDEQLAQNIEEKQDEVSGTSSDGVEGVIRDAVVGLLSDVLEILVGESITATAQSPIERPPLLANAEGVIGANYYLPCNLKRRSPLQMAVDMVSSMVDAL